MALSARSTAGVRATVTTLLCLASGFSLGLLGGSCAAPTDPGSNGVAATATGNLEVLVRDTQLRPVAGARILVGDVAAVSDTAGRAVLPVQARGRVVGQVRKVGFLDASVVGELSEGARLRVFATMVATAPPQWFKAESGATLVAGPVSLELPGDAFQDQKGDLVAGMIEANLTPVRLADLLNVGLPWTLEGVPADGAPAGIAPQQRRTVKLLSFGMLDGVFRSKGESLQLRPGKTARMRYRLDAQGASRMQADGAAGVPLWF